MKKKAGFTLIELMVAIAVFGVIIMVATTTLLDVIQNSSRAQVQNELRQNAEKVLSDIGSSVRSAGCTSFGTGVSNTLTTYSDASCSSNPVSYISTISPPVYSLTKKVGISGVPYSLISSAVAPCFDTGAPNTCGSCATNGFVVTQSASGTPPSTWLTWTGGIQVSLGLQQYPGPIRSSYCGKVQLIDTFLPRN